MKRFYFLYFIFIAHFLHTALIANHDINRPSWNIITLSGIVPALDLQNKATTLESFCKPPEPKTLSPTDHKNVYKQAIAWDLTCRQNFGMNACSYEHMMRLNYTDFTNKILSNPNYNNQTIKTLWQNYLDRSIFKRKKNVAKYTQIIEQELNRREEEKERIFTAQKTYNSIVLRNQNYQSPHQQMRESTLLQTNENNFAKVTKTYSYDAQTTGILMAHGINQTQTENLSGTNFQHQLFQEAAACYKKAAKIAYEYAFSQSLMIPHILNFAHVAQIATEHEIFNLAMQLNDIADLLAETSLSICKGIAHSTLDTVNIFLHPQHTAQQLGAMLTSVFRLLGGALNAYDHEPSAHTHHLKTAQKIFAQDITTFNQISLFAKQEYKDWWSQSSAQDKTESFSKVIADLVLQPKLIGMAAKSCWKLLSPEKETAIITDAISSNNALQSERFIIDVAANVKQEQTVTKIEAPLIDLIEAECIEAKGPILLPEILDESMFIANMLQPNMQNLLFKNKKLQKDVIRYFDQYFYQKELLEFCKDVQKTNFVIKVQHAGQEVTMLCNPEHMMTYQLDFKNILDTRKAEGIIGGGHVGLYLEELAKKKFITIISDTELCGGCKAIKIKHIFGTEILQKTIWPPEWHAEQIMQSIKEAWHNKRIMKRSLKSKNVLGVIGTDINGIEIEMFVEILNEKTIKLKTAYPHFKGFSNL